MSSKLVLVLAALVAVVASKSAGASSALGESTTETTTGSSTSTITYSTTSQETTPTPTPTTTDAPDRPCDPRECWQEGICQDYKTCVNGTLTIGKCDADLFWNNDPSLNIHGGSCVFWDNLLQNLKDDYLNPQCVPDCEWKGAGDCDPSYTYLEPFNGTLVNRQTYKYKCLQHPVTGEQLIWNQAKLTCDRRANVAACT